MKRTLLTSMILAGVLLAQTGFSQVYVHANIAFGHPGAFCPPPSRVVYQQAYPIPAPYYNNYRNEKVVIDPGYGYAKAGYTRERYENRERFDRCFRERHRNRW